MRRPTHIALAVLLGATVTGATWLVLHRRAEEPVYGGKRLTVWMGQYQMHLLAARSSPDRAKRDAAENAIRQIGTNALPALLSMVQAKDTTLKRILTALGNKQSLIKFRLHSADYYHATATYGFGALGPTAKPAVPALINLLHDGDREVRASAAHCLSLVGPEARDAVPALVHLLNTERDAYGPALVNSMHALGPMHSEPETVVPLLLEYVNGSRQDRNYCAPAMDALAGYREKAKAAVPAILPLLNDPDAGHRDSAFHALWQIDPEAAAQERRK